jgi:hypothetical protein
MSRSMISAIVVVSISPPYGPGSGVLAHLRGHLFI